MLNYKDYEQEVYNWLLTKHHKDNSFTFSLRQKASKGSETDIFIGTEKSNYFGTTFWTLPVYYPGSSSDSINLIFGNKGDYYGYKFEFSQTNDPKDAQNKSVLNVIKAIQEPLKAQLNLQREGSPDKKMFAIVSKHRAENYTDLNTMLLDIEKDLGIIIPIVNNAIKLEKEQSPDFTAHPITINEFNIMQEKYEARKLKYSNGTTKLNSSDNIKYWLYAPGRNTMYWDAFFEDEIIGLGWDKLGDLTKYANKSEVKKALTEAYGGDGNKINDIHANFEFANEINIGDIVIVKKGRGELLGYGEVTSDYFFDEDRTDYKSCRSIKWIKKGNWPVDINLVLKTLTDVTKYPSKIGGFTYYYEHLIALMDGNLKNDLFSMYYNYLLKTRSGEIKITTAEGYVETAYNTIPERWSKLYKTNFDTFELNFDNLKKIIPLTENGFSGYTSFRPFIIDLVNQYRENIKPINQILFGPPGTGKTFYLKNKLFANYTTSETSITKSQYLENKISELSWWEVIAIALIDLKKATVPMIRNHKWVQIKERLSNSSSVNNTLWTQLQTHTIDESINVKFTKRRSPQIFNKNESSHWEILEDEAIELIPELYSLKDSAENYNPNPNKIIKRYEFVTFHQSFAYEDFIEGIKPILPDNEEEMADLSYKIEDGIFKNLCLKAKNDPDNRYAIFIDEINRGNVSAIYGELITLIETDKRAGAKNELSIKLPYSKKEFSVPSNLDIYGTMNTADRSVEALDTALRRRFEFKEMMPDYAVIINEKVKGKQLSEVLKTINRRIELLIDRDHTIGHSYFVGVDTPEKLANAFNNKIVPLLQEYFYGDYGKIGLVLGEGFVQIHKNETVTFAKFNYDNANDFKAPTFSLKQVDEDSIMQAIDLLLGTIEEEN